MEVRLLWRGCLRKLLEWKSWVRHSRLTWKRKRSNGKWLQVSSPEWGSHIWNRIWQSSPRKILSTNDLGQFCIYYVSIFLCAISSEGILLLQYQSTEKKRAGCSLDIACLNFFLSCHLHRKISRMQHQGAHNWTQTSRNHACCCKLMWSKNPWYKRREVHARFMRNL